MLSMKKCVIFLLICIALLTGCKKTETEKAQSKQIVKINGTTYTARDLWNFANITIWEMEAKDLTNEQIKDEILTTFIEHKLIIEEARKKSYAEDNTKLDQFSMQLSTEQGEAELKAVTGRYNIDAKQIARLEQERALIDRLFLEVASASDYISETELKKYYEERKTLKPQEGQAHILHIFTTDNTTAQLAAKDLASGILFSEVARKYSESPENTRGGDLGFVQETNLPEFFEAAFRLKEGETSAVIKSDYGYHIFRLVSYATAGDATYESMKNILLAELYTIKRQDFIREYINALISRADIQYLNNFTIAELITAGS